MVSKTPTLNELPDGPQELTPQEILQHRVYNLLLEPYINGALPYMTAKQLADALLVDVELVIDALLILEDDGNILAHNGPTLWEGLE